MKIKIMVDTAADCSEAEYEKLDVEKLELPVTFDGDDEACGNAEEFWQKLLSGRMPRTSQPSPETLKTRFLQAKEENCPLILILISSALSATYQSAVNIKNEVGYDGIYVIDSQNATVGEKMLVTEACRLRDGGADAEEIAQKLEMLKPRIRVYACVDTLKYLAAGGRISKTAAGIGTLLNVKPLICVEDGLVKNYGKAIGFTLAANNIVQKFINDKISPDFPVIPIYSHTPDNCQAFLLKAKQKGAHTEGLVPFPIGATIASHIGPSAFGIAYVIEE